MGQVKFGDVVKEVKINIDRTNNPYDYYVAGDHMDSEDLTIRRKGSFATDDVGPAFTRLFKPGQILYGSRRTYLKKVAVADFEGICSNTTFVLETKDEGILRQRLLPFIMLTEEFTKWSISKSKGSTNPYILFSDDGFDRFYNCTSGIPSYVNIFASLLPVNEQLDDEAIKMYFDKKIQAISSHLINIWSRLSFREQTIIIILLEKPMRRIDIANELGISTGSLSNYLNNLQNQGLISLNKGLYEIAEPILKRWLELEFKEKGIYPYRNI